MALQRKRTRDPLDRDSISESSSEGAEQLPPTVPNGQYVVDRVLAYDPATRQYLIHWRGFDAKDRTWQRAHDLVVGEGSAVERFRLRDMANVGWVFGSADAKRAFHEKHDLIDLGELPVAVANPNTNTRLHPLSKEQRKEYVEWLKARIGQCEWVAGCTHRVSRADGDGGWPIVCFDFHHVRAATKAHTVSTMPVTIFPAESIWAEAAKCILLCKLHHAIVEYVTHGGEEGYSPECAGRGEAGCAFRGHSLYDYVHPDAGRHEREQAWTTPDLLAQRGRPWRPQDAPPAQERKAKLRR
jgi:hypothetical protein